jgi:Flp pilus assembly pilin Flp
MVQKIKSAIANRAAALRSDEKGMEAAQVILILVIVVIVLIPVINLIAGELTRQGSRISSNIRDY